MSGAFTPPGQEDGPGANGPQFRGPTGADLLNANPNQYMIQGLPSVNYNSTDPNRRYTMPDVAIGSNYYDAPRFADGGQVMPDYLAEGGIPSMMPMGISNLRDMSRFAPTYRTAPSAGIAGLAAGGYPRKTGQISGPGTEKSDSIPAMLSDGEFVMTAKAVRGLGKGSRREGAKRMYALMHQLERNAARG
jgi:hypothetical protein